MKKLLLVLALFTMFFALSACGTTDDTEESVHSQGVTDTEIRIGNTAVTGGALGFVGAPFIAGMQAYINMVNEDGGVLNGRLIRLVHYSDNFDGDQGLTYTQRLVEVDKVFAMVGHFGTPTVGATAQYLDGLGVPRVYYGTGSSLVYNENATGGERASFPVQPVYEFEGELMAARAVDQFGAQKIGVLYTPNENGNEIKAGVERMAQTLGVDVFSAQVSGTDYASAALAIVNADVDVVIVAMNQWAAQAGLINLGLSGSTVPAIISYVGADASVIDGIKDFWGAMNFDIFANAWVSTLDESGELTDAFKEFQTQIARAHPEYINNSFAVAGWIAAQVFVEGLKLMDEDEPITWENFINAMESQPFEYDLGAPIDYTNGQRTGTKILSLLQMHYDAEAGGYFDVVAAFEHLDDIVARIQAD